MTFDELLDSIFQLNDKRIKVILGSGGIKVNSWILTDKDTLDITSHESWAKMFKPNTIDIIFSEHVFEHLTMKECETAIKLSYIYLKKGGLFRIAVPDGYRKDRSYVEEIMPPRYGHKIVFNIDSLKPLLENSGFKVTALEYFDKDDKFHYTIWDTRDGKVRRSKRFDKQTAFKRDHYYCTSLILDAIK